MLGLDRDVGILGPELDEDEAAAFEPQKSFAGLAPTGRWWDAVSFAMASLVLSVSGTLALYAVIGGIAGLIAGMDSLKSANPLVVVGVVLAVVAGMAIVFPLFALMRIYIGAGIDHLCLLLLGGGKSGFDATLRAYCYAMSPGVFGLIPVCSGYFWEIWRLVLSILAYKNVHRMSGGRATAAVLLPLGFCCVGYIGIIAVSAAFGHS